jgi:hypothetical protein
MSDEDYPLPYREPSDLERIEGKIGEVEGAIRAMQDRSDAGLSAIQDLLIQRQKEATRQTQYLVVLCLIGAGILGIVWRAFG